MSYTIQLTHAPTPEERTHLHDHLREFNRVTSPWHRAAREPGAIEPLALFVRDAAGQIIGGLTADTYWDSWLEIADLWLDESLRGQGLGAELLRRAETEAMVRGCIRAHLQTFSFQARGFYEKYGWRVVGAMEDFPPGQTFYWMRKEFGRPDEHVSFHSVQSEADVLDYLAQINRKFRARPQVVRHIQAQVAGLPVAQPVVVELCHGPGLLARRLASRLPHIRYTGFDFSGPFVRFTGRQLEPFGPRAAVIRADLNGDEWLARLPDAVHAIVSLQSLHDLGGEAEVSRIYRLARERLAPGGLLLNADLVAPEGGEVANNPGRLPVSRHLQLLRNLGFDAVTCTLQVDEFACITANSPA
ncbi:MAG: hypothetical protein Kow0031_30180 [Anaerolineae bacterium]